jgi:hypothetical protein
MMLTEFQRMRIICDEFPLPLVDSVVIAKMDTVVLAAERLVLAGFATHREAVLRAAKACAARAFDQIDNSNSQKYWQEHADELHSLVDVMDGRALGPNVAGNRPP